MNVPEKCRDLEILLPDWVDGLLPSEEAARIQRHVATCYHCTVEAERWRELSSRLAGGVRTEVPAVPLTLSRQIVEAVQAEAPAHPAQRRAPHLAATWPTVTATAGAFLALFAFARLTLQTVLPPGRTAAIEAAASAWTLTYWQEWTPVILWIVAGLALTYALLGENFDVSGETRDTLPGHW